MAKLCLLSIYMIPTYPHYKLNQEIYRMGRKCLTEITLKQLQFSPTLTGKHNLIGKIPVHNVFPYLAQSHVLVTKRWYIQKTQIRVMK